MVNATYFIEKVDCLNKNKIPMGLQFQVQKLQDVQEAKFRKKGFKSALLIAKASF